MKPSVFRVLTATALLGGSLFSVPAHAAAKQFVIVVSDGLGPQTIDFGKAYLRKADQDPDESTAFDDLANKGTVAKPDATSFADLKGLLETAQKAGYKTGFVTTGDIAADAAVLYNLPGEAGPALISPDTNYDFIAGGGRGKLPKDAKKKVTAAGGAYLPNEESIDGEITGKVLAPQADEDLDFAIDRDPQLQAGLTELSVLAIDTMGSEDNPFVLVVHDTLIKKALETKDSPALAEQFRELNGIVADAVSRRQDSEDFKAAFLFTGGVSGPRFSTTVDEEQQNSLFMLSNLLVSFHGAGEKLKGADNDAINTFADPNEGLYRGWKISDSDREKLVAGTLDPEAAVRASYEPSLKLSYDAPAAAPLAYSLGLDGKDGIGAALKAAVAVPPPPKPVEPPAPAPPADDQ